MKLSSLRIESLEEWKALVNKLEQEREYYKNAALKAPTLEKLRYMEGFTDAIEMFIALPEILFKEKD